MKNSPIYIDNFCKTKQKTGNQLCTITPTELRDNIAIVLPMCRQPLLNKAVVRLIIKSIVIEEYIVFFSFKHKGRKTSL